MAELGSGGGSDYPSTLDTDTIKETDNSTLARADVPNDLAAAIVAIENELGTDPAGSKADVKTFLQTEHNTDGTHTSVIVKTDGTALKKIVKDIGDWDMDGTASVNVAHGLSASFINIRSAIAMIRDDSSVSNKPLNAPAGAADTTPQGAVGNIDSTNVNLVRLTGGDFDSVSYDSTSFNRGWVVITYEV